MRLQCAGHALSSADRRVHVAHELGRVRRVQVGGLAGVHHRTAADRDEAVEAALRGEADRVVKRAVGRLDLHVVVDGDIDAGRHQRGLDSSEGLTGGEATVGEQTDASQPELAGLLPASARTPAPKVNVGIPIVKPRSLPRRPSVAAAHRGLSVGNVTNVIIARTCKVSIGRMIPGRSPMPRYESPYDPRRCRAI